MNEIVTFLNDNSGVAVLISSVSTLISAISVVIAFYFNAKTQNQYKTSLEPQLTMRLEKQDRNLYLIVQNRGKLAAKNVSVKVISIEENVNQELSVDKIFEKFDLYPNEEIHGEIAQSNENINTGELSPVINIALSYQVHGRNNHYCYSRNVALSKLVDSRILADVNIDLKEIESKLAAIARAEVRMANYLDGRQVAVFDELNILAHQSLKNDMCSAIEKSKASEILDRLATIEECLKTEFYSEESSAEQQEDQDNG